MLDGDPLTDSFAMLKAKPVLRSKVAADRRSALGPHTLFPRQSCRILGTTSAVSLAMISKRQNWRSAPAAPLTPIGGQGRTRIVQVGISDATARSHPVLLPFSILFNEK